MVAFAFLFGLIFGSFANVILLRLNTGESIIVSGSRCFSCSRKLKWFELIPIFSFIALRARCRSCKSRISIQYPLVELGTGVLFVLLIWKLLGFYNLGGSDSFGYWVLPDYLLLITHNSLLITHYSFLLLAWFFLWVAALYDARHMILPDSLLLTAFLFGVGSFAFACMSGTSCSLYGIGVQFGAAFLAFLFFFLLWFISQGKWMGFGDAKFAFALAPLFSYELLLVAMLLSFFIGSAVGIFLLIFQRAGLKTKVPFGPFLFAGALISFLAGHELFLWYMGLFGGVI